MLVSLKVPPGLYRQGTEYQAQGRYYDADLVRWFEGTMRPIGGWRQYRTAINSTISVSGKARGMHTWSNNTTERYAAVGTHTGLYAFGTAIQTVQDITPAGLAPGAADNQANTGYGGNVYGGNTYGTPRVAQSISLFATTWSMDNFGEFLVAVQSEDGRLFYWDLLTATAVPVTATAGTTPVNNKGVLVTDERFVFLLQAGGNRRRIAWSDQENLFNWNITATTQAGDFELATPGEIMTAVKARGQTLILTSTDVWAANYIGPPLVYGFERVADGAGCVSRNAACVADKLVFWMNDSSFWVFDGFAKPLPCDVADFVFNGINRGQLEKVWAVHANDFGEVTWFYPSNASTEIDRYVTYNYRENHWSIGSMKRTIGVDSRVFNLPIRVDSSGNVFEHEVSNSYDGQMPFAQTGPLEINGGETVAMCKYLYPDEKTQGQVQALFATRFYPNANEFTHGPYSMSAPTSIRFTGRQVAARFESVGSGLNELTDGEGSIIDVGDGSALVEQGFVGADWRIGNIRMDVELGGMR